MSHGVPVQKPEPLFYSFFSASFQTLRQRKPTKARRYLLTDEGAHGILSYINSDVFISNFSLEIGFLKKEAAQPLIMRISALVNNKKFFLPFISIGMSLLIIFLIGSTVMGFKRTVATQKDTVAIHYYNSVNAKMKAENIKAFEKTLKASFSRVQLVKIAQYKTKYGININGTPVGKNTNKIISERSTVSILISENYSRVSLDSLPRSIIEMGSVMELKSASTIVKVSYGKATLKTRLYNYYYGKSLSYLVTGLKPGDIITLEILPEIAQKIGLEDNVIEIFYNKAMG
jgi:hypothetical protein